MEEVHFQRAKDPENRSKKGCCCGGHNANNPKSNLRNHSTWKNIYIV